MSPKYFIINTLLNSGSPGPISRKATRMVLKDYIKPILSNQNFFLFEQKSKSLVQVLWELMLFDHQPIVFFISLDLIKPKSMNSIFMLNTYHLKHASCIEAINRI